MRILYFDCGGGVSGDMALNVLCELGGCADEVRAAMEAEDFTGDGHCGHDHVHGHDHGHKNESAHEHDEIRHAHGRSYADVKALIENSSFSESAKATALSIYGYIAEAEASVHGATLETVHFHEVGRDGAVKNALGIGMALEAISPDKIEVSDIWDGHGTVICSHGEIPVPVPAVMALRERCDYIFRTADVDTEMVTPSGLAALMGIGAVPAAKAGMSGNADGGVSAGTETGARAGRPEGKIIKRAEARGGRDTGRGGLKAFIIDAADAAR